MTVYLDTSVIVPIFVDDSFSAQAQAVVAAHRSNMIIGDFASAEFASALSLRCRMNLLDVAEARAAFADFDLWKTKMQSATLDSADTAAAEVILRRLDLPLRTPDAMHIAMARRLGADLATFDLRLAASAHALGVTVVPA